MQLNTSTNPCDSIVSRAARVVAIGTQSIVVADTLNPSGGFTTADYQRFAARFESATDPLAVTPLPLTGTSGSLIPGGAGFYRFAVAPAATATLTLASPAGAVVQGFVVRLR